MSYTINYETVAPKAVKGTFEPKLKKASIKLIVITAIIGLVWLITPVRVAVLDFLLPGKGDITRKAAGEFIADVKQGEPIKEAFTEFCIEIVENA